MDTPTKRCKQCGEDKSLSEFYKKHGGKHGVTAICKICRCLNDGFIPRVWRESVPDGMKCCTHCKELLPATSDYFNRTPKGSGLISICRSCRKAKRNAEYANDPETREKAIAKTRAWYQVNRDRALESKREYTKQNAQANRDRVKKWKLDNPERYKALNAYSPQRYTRMKRRRAHKLGAGGSHTAADIQLQYEKQGGRCFWCSEFVDTYHVDHVVPLSRGGSDNADNLVIACPSCNGSKSDRLVYTEWIPPNPLT